MILHIFDQKRGSKMIKIPGFYWDYFFKIEKTLKWLYVVTQSRFFSFVISV